MLLYATDNRSEISKMNSCGLKFSESEYIDCNDISSYMISNCLLLLWFLLFRGFFCFLLLFFSVSVSFFSEVG